MTIAGLSKRIVTVLLSAALFAAPSTPSSAAKHRHSVVQAPVTSGSLQLFASESAAQRHCPADTVVWLNTNSGIYHEKGMRWYGNTKAGAYVCRREADAAGDRDTRNGQ
jgi:hypothetical protein